jgi:hypothetical protein
MVYHCRVCKGESLVGQLDDDAASVACVCFPLDKSFFLDPPQ